MPCKLRRIAVVAGGNEESTFLLLSREVSKKCIAGKICNTCHKLYPLTEGGNLPVQFLANEANTLAAEIRCRYEVGVLVVTQDPIVNREDIGLTNPESG